MRAYVLIYFRLERLLRDLRDPLLEALLLRNRRDAPPFFPTSLAFKSAGTSAAANIA